MAAERLPGFLGRSIERALLDRLLEDVRQGQGAVLVIRGEAGVGKTALLRYAAEQASGFRVTQITGAELEMELAYAGLHQLCVPMLSRLDVLPEPQQVALRVALGLASGASPDPFLVALGTLGLMSVAAEERPLFCVVDDLQWLDDASAAVLGFVARRLLAEPVALVFAVREPDGEHRLTGLPELPLQGLDDVDAHALLEAAIPGRIDERVRGRIVAETRGNPLALLELPRGMSAAELAGGFALPAPGGLPSRIEDGFRRRLDALPADTRRLLQLAAADPVGEPLLTWRAAGRLGIHPDAATPAVDADLIEIGAQVRFRHPLLRSAAYRSAASAERHALHAALAEATDPQIDPDRRAWHLAQAAAGPDEEVAGELEHSAARAQARGGVAAAAAFLESAATLTPEPARRLHRLLAAARAKRDVGALEAALRLLTAAEDARLGRTRLRVELARGHLLYGEWLRREHRRIDAREQLHRAYDMFSTIGADGFAERARHELLATGETVRKRRNDAREELTPQEEHIARLALAGRTNPEIGAELFISAHTGEWHLRKVFMKLGISSRKSLRDALPPEPHAGTPRNTAVATRPRH